MNWSDQDWNRRYEALYKCQLSALYHRKRERFFEASDKATKAIAVIGGSAAWAKLWDVEWIAAMIAVTSTLALVLGLSERARRHAQLAARFVTLQAEIESAGVMDETKADGFMARAVSLEAEEPAELSALTRLCQNEIAMARGEAQSVLPLTWRERWFAHWFDMPKYA